MKKFLLVMLLAILFSFAFLGLGISQAGQCIYLGNVGNNYYYYDSSSVRYSGNIVSYNIYDNAKCEESFIHYDVDEIDCAKRMVRHQDMNGKWGSWKSFTPGSIVDKARIKLCR